MNDPGSAAVTASQNRSVESSPSRRPETPCRPRLQHLRERISSPPSGSRSRSDAEDGSDSSASPRRPRLRHRFSRSLTSLAAARTDSDHVGRVEEDESPLAKWRARSKAKLVRAFAPTLDDRSGPSYSAGSVSPHAVFDAPLPRFESSEARTPSRNRSHSAPLLLTRSTELVSPAPVSAHRLCVLATPSSPLSPVPPSSPLSPVPPSATLESPPQSPFHTCPSSPWTDTPFVFSNADIFSNLSASADGVRAAADPQRAASTRRCITELPREVQLEVFRALLFVCEEDWRRAIREGEWISEVARQRWSDGRSKGRREIVKLGRVCKLWRDLSLDGQLWSDAPSATFLGPDSLPAESVDRLATNAGSFLTSLDARGLGSKLDWKTLIRIVETAQLTNGQGVTRLKKIDLTGCTALTAASLATLLSHSPLLSELLAPGLRCINEGHMRVLGSDCPRLAVLDVSRCACLAAAALLHLPYPPPRHEGAAPSDGTSPGGLRTLKAAGLSGMTDFVVGGILERHSGLETLDVSFSRLHDDALQRFVSLPATRSDAEPASTGPSHVPEKRCFPALRHLSLTGCASLTSTGLGHLAVAIPNVEILEIARFGVRARTEGIARLIAACPKLRWIDLEDNHELGDDAILALVPSGTSRGSPNLEHLIISACPALTDDAIASVATNSPKLRVLEADGTAISDRTARLFIRLAQGRAITAQAVAASREKHPDPLVGAWYPAILSVLDNRTTGRRLSRDIGAKHLRPRNGQRGYWTRTVGDYHDEPPPSGDETVSDARRKEGSSLGECDPTRVVVRSFHSSLAVDAADAARRALTSATTSGAASESKLGAMRLRSLSDSEVFRRGTSYPHEDNARTGCIIS